MRQHANYLFLSDDTPKRYELSAPVGPATLRAWGGKLKRESMPIACVQIGKAYVSFHHMAFYGSAKLRNGMSRALRQRMQGKTCFNFRTADETLFAELETLTNRGCRGLKTAGFIR
jgi:hypothetical protein